MNKIREKFESLRNPEIIARYKFSEEENIYDPIEGNAFNEGGTYAKAEQITNALVHFTEGYQQAVKDMEAKWVNLNYEMPAIGHPVVIKYKGYLQNETWILDATDGDLSGDTYWLEPYGGGEGEHCISSENFNDVEWISLAEAVNHE